MHVGETHLAAVEQIGQALVIHAHQVQHGGVDIVIGNGLLGGFVAEVVGRADHLAAADSGSGHPHRHRAGIVIAAQAFCEIGMRPNSVCHITSVSSSKPPLLEVANQARDGLVDFTGVRGVVVHQIAVRIPVVDVGAELGPVE